MPPKRTSTSETPAITLDAIQQLISNGIATALEAQAATISASNPNRNTGPTGTPVAVGLIRCCLVLVECICPVYGIEQANQIPVTELKRLLMEQELAVLCPNMVPNTEKLMEAFIGGLPQSIEGNVTASKPQTLEEATNIAHRLMDIQI
ncbi:hypothetical protein Tco_0064984 [Tanacetum coccineum]